MKRRDFLVAAVVAPLAPAATAAKTEGGAYCPGTKDGPINDLDSVLEAMSRQPPHCRFVRNPETGLYLEIWDEETS